MDNNFNNNNNYNTNNNVYYQNNFSRYYMKTDRSVLTFVLLTIVTCGIYSFIFFTSLANDLNIAATGRDGKKTMNYCLMVIILNPSTCGIASYIWFHKMSERVGEEAVARGIKTDFGATTFWIWYVLGSMIIVGPFIYMNELCMAMNRIAMSYNTYGR